MCYITHVLSRASLWSSVGFLAVLAGCGPKAVSESDLCKLLLTEDTMEQWSEGSQEDLECVGMFHKARTEMGDELWARFSRCVADADTREERGSCPGIPVMEKFVGAPPVPPEMDSCDAWFFPAYAGGRPLPRGDYDGRHGNKVDCQAARQAMQRNAAGMVRVGTCACVSADGQ